MDRRVNAVVACSPFCVPGGDRSRAGEGQLSAGGQHAGGQHAGGQHPDGQHHAGPRLLLLPHLHPGPRPC